MDNSKLIGRTEELNILRQFFASEQAEFLAMYGRRRVGKTFLINQFYKNKTGIFFKATGSKNAPLEEQIKHFTKVISRVFYNNAPITAGSNWDETFEILTSAINQVSKKSKITLFLDEFPWMATKNSRLLENLDYYWNQYWSNNDNIKLIICGSSASWIIRKIVNNRAGLHNRITKKIRLKPFDLKETEQYLLSKNIKLNKQQILQIYMIMGGIPYYLSFVQKGMTAGQVIDLLAFSAGSFLSEEFNNLLPSLFDDYEIYADILRIIASVRQGIGKKVILEKLDKSQYGSQGLAKLKDLEESGFIKSFKSHFNKKKGIYYRLIDEYSIFYFNWLEPLQDTLQKSVAATGSFQEMQQSSKWQSWLGYAFEAVCYKHINLIREKLDISPAAVANTWRYLPKKSKNSDGEADRGAQIDLLFDRLDHAITICEIKYSEQQFVIDKQYAKNLMNKCDVFVKRTKTKKQIFIAIVAANGLKDNMYSDDLITGVVSLQDLFV